MIARRRFLAATGLAALGPVAAPLLKALPAPPPAPALLASNALALLRG
ncbi:MULTISPECIES: hypothetical protein [unclassified Sphingomonas]|nr:hypothetical protein [Sphingomonas sp. SORGH_AS_0879]MDQ1231164.1 hypothetical protein [Sphingomonas sp. SORGH_AS_0879]